MQGRILAGIICRVNVCQGSLAALRQGDEVVRVLMPRRRCVTLYYRRVNEKILRLGEGERAIERTGELVRRSIGALKAGKYAGKCQAGTI